MILDVKRPRVRPVLSKTQALWIAADAEYHATTATTPSSRARWRAIARTVRKALEPKP